MRLRSVLGPSVFVGMTLMAFAASAGTNCTCRGNGQDIPEGETVCLKTASGTKLARCERVLNNTSWTILESGCPVARLGNQSDWRQNQG